MYQYDSTLVGRALSKFRSGKTVIDSPAACGPASQWHPSTCPHSPLPIIRVPPSPSYPSLSPYVSLSLLSSLSPHPQPSTVLSAQAAVAPSPAGIFMMLASRVSIPVRAGKTERPSSPAQSSQLVSRTVLSVQCNAVVADEDVCVCMLCQAPITGKWLPGVSISQQQMRCSFCHTFPCCPTCVAKASIACHANLPRAPVVSEARVSSAHSARTCRSKLAFAALSSSKACSRAFCLS